MTGPNVPTPSALESGEEIRDDLTPEERGALLCAIGRGLRGDDLTEVADALGLCGPRTGSGAYMATSAGNARLSPDFGSQKVARR